MGLKEVIMSAVLAMNVATLHAQVKDSAAQEVLYTLYTRDGKEYEGKTDSLFDADFPQLSKRIDQYFDRFSFDQDMKAWEVKDSVLGNWKWTQETLEIDLGEDIGLYRYNVQLPFSVRIDDIYTQGEYFKFKGKFLWLFEKTEEYEKSKMKSILMDIYQGILHQKVPETFLLSRRVGTKLQLQKS